MSAHRKILVDHNLGEGFYTLLKQKFRGGHIELSSKIANQHEWSPDHLILSQARRDNYYLITGDKDFGVRGDYPCRQDIYANRTVVLLPYAPLTGKLQAVVRAWNAMTWNVVKSAPVLVVNATQATLYHCEGSRYVESKTVYY